MRNYKLFYYQNESPSFVGFVTIPNNASDFELLIASGFSVNTITEPSSEPSLIYLKNINTNETVGHLEQF